MGSMINLPLPNLTRQDPMTGNIDVVKALKKTQNYLSQLQTTLNTALNSIGTENFTAEYREQMARSKEANEALDDFIDRLVKEGMIDKDADVGEAYQALINKIIRDAKEISEKITKAKEELDIGFKSWVQREYIARSDLGKYEKLENCTVEQSAWAYAISFITNSTVSVDTAAGLLSNTNTLLSKAEFTAEGLRFTDNQITTTVDEEGNETQTIVEQPFSILIHSGGIKFQFSDNGTFKNIGYIQTYPDGTLENKIYFNNIHAYNILTIGNTDSGFYDLVVKHQNQSLTFKYRSE